MLPDTQGVQQVVHVERVFGEILCHLDVLANGEVGHQVVELENKAQLTAAVLHQLAVLELGDVRAAYRDASRVNLLQAAHQVEERGLAGAGRAKQDADFAPRDLRGYGFEHRDVRVAVAVALGEVLDGKKAVIG